VPRSPASSSKALLPFHRGPRPPGEGAPGRVRFSEHTLCLLFAADRMDHSRELEPALAGGTHVISDRFVWSSIAYQSLDPSITPQHVIDANAGCTVPDITIFLNVPVDRCIERLAQRNDSPTVYERKDLLEAIDRNYQETRALYEKHFGPVLHVDGALSPEAVHDHIVKALATYLDM
jgi:dTMP kinase